MEKIRWKLIAASLVLLGVVVMGAWVAAATGNEDEPTTPETQQYRPDSDDPTAIPTVTPPSRVPPPPDQLENRPADVDAGRRSPELPSQADVTQRPDGKYEAKGPDGCAWIETRRLNLARQNINEAVLTSPCAEDITLHIDLDTGELSFWSN